MPGGYIFDGFTPETLRARGSIKWNYYAPDVLACWVAEMDFATAPEVRAAISEWAARDEVGYPRMDAVTGVPEAVAAFQAEHHGWVFDPERVHILPDVLKGVELGIRLFSPESSAIVLPTPAYMPFFEIPVVTRRQVIYTPTALDGDRRVLDLDAIAAAFAAGAGTLILCHPYNPLGRSFTPAELGAVAEVVDRYGGRVVADEIHAPLTYPGARHVPYASVSEAAAAHTLTLTSASKAWNLPGLKCAQAITSNDSDERRWRTLGLLDTHGASTVGVAASVAAWTGGGPWLGEAVSRLDENRRLLGSLLSQLVPEIGYVPPEATYLAWLDCRAVGLEEDPSEFFLREARVAVNPGPAFGAGGAGHVRLNFATSPAILTRAVEAMAGALGRRPS